MKTVEQTLGKGIERERVETSGEFFTASKLHTLAKIFRGVALETDGEDSARVRADSSFQEVAGTLSQQFCFADHSVLYRNVCA